jgi:hypothetical protein
MMDRGVMQRQMFAKGGAAFPDLSGDGEVTRKDILMGRGVPMQMGGEPQMAQGIATMAEEMPPVPEGVDPAMLEQMLTEASTRMGDLEEAGSYEQMMNMMRGDEAPVEQRREELASLVGPEDAAQTPDSVLALVQPVVQLASVDQGIGELAQEQMTAPVEGAMAEGIMSTVAPPPQPAAPGPMMDPATMGGPPPVNFNQGGVVRPVVYMKEGGDPLKAAYESRLPLYQSIVGDPTAQLEEQKRMTQAQMLFDIAGTALAFAGPMEGERKGLSPAERLALATQKTQLLPTIGARAGELLKSKQAATAKDQQMKLGALSAAEADLTAQSKAKADAALAAQQAKATATENALDRAATTGNIVLKGSVDMEMAESKENWRAAAADTQRLAEKEAATLLASRNLAAQNAGKKLQNQLDIGKMLLESEITLDRLGVEDAYKLNQQKIGHDYAMTLQEANLKVTRARDANNVALKIADQELEEAKMLQTAERDAATARINQRKQALEEEKLELEQAAKGLETFGKTGKNKAQSILANPELLDGYAKGTLDETQTIQVSNAIDLLSTQETIVQDGQSVKTGGSIPEAARKAVIARSKLPAAEGQTRLMPRDINRITAVPTKFGEATSKIMSNVPDASIAFGSDAVARNVINTATEALSFGLAKAPFESTEKAISAVKQLNLDTVTHFQDIKELRDSVALLNHA